MTKVDYPKNIQDWFSDGRDKEFALWAFGCEQPGSNQKMIECWETLHPEYRMRDRDSTFICICKMNYLYQQQKSVRSYSMKWINIKDSLPEKECVCVVWNETRPFQYYISTFSPYFKEFEVRMIGSSRLNDPICFNATHWIQLDSPTLVEVVTE